MGKEAVRDQLHVFLGGVTDYAIEEFRPLAVVGLGFLPGNSVAKVFLSPIIDKEISSIKISLQNEFNIIMEYSEGIAEGENPDPEEYKDRFLQSDFFYQHYEGDEREEFEEVMMQRLDEVARDMAPLVEVDTEDFWEALEESYDRREAEEILKYHFSFTDKIVEEFGDDLNIRISFGPISIGYTKEALRVMPKAEGHLRREIVDKLDEIYGKDRDKDVESLEELEEENEELRQELERLREERVDSDGEETEESEASEGEDTVGGGEVGAED
jgi:hypothetical protein